MMNKKTQQTLTIIGVGVVAFLGVRYLMNKTKKGSDEKKSNLLGNNCTCADGTTGRCSTDCATCCKNLGGVDEVGSVSSGGDFSTTVHRAKSKFSRASGTPVGTSSDDGHYCWNGSRWVPKTATTLCDNPVYGVSSNRLGGNFSRTVNRAKSKFSRADGAPCGCGN